MNIALKHSLIVFFILFLSILYNPTILLCSYNADDGFKIASDLIDKGQYLEAIGQYKGILFTSQNINVKSRAMLFMGKAYSTYLDQYDAALMMFDAVLNKYPSSHAALDALFNKGIILYDKGDFKQAYNVFLKYINDYPKGIRKQSAIVWADTSKAQMEKSESVLLTREKILSNTKIQPSDKLNINDTLIRVLIQKQAQDIILNSETKITVSDIISGSIIYSGPGPLKIGTVKKSIFIQGIKEPIKQCHIRSSGNIMKLGDNSFRGYFTLLNNTNGFDIINNIQIEEYLYGVLPKEMPPKWAKQALMAQAIASRTYALYVKKRSRHRFYDIEAGTSFQAYGGYSAETQASNLAVDLTKGQVVTHNGELIVAYFHSSSGGYTEDSKNVWSADIPYLKGVKDVFSQDCPDTGWDLFLSNKDAQQILEKSGLMIGKINKISAWERSVSGRVLTLKIYAEKKYVLVSANIFRIKIGATKLKSTLFRVISKSNGIYFKGTGYGHGVGMSQWGAYKMAQKGFSYKEILKHYYKNIDIKSIAI